MNMQPLQYKVLMEIGKIKKVFRYEDFLKLFRFLNSAMTADILLLAFYKFKGCRVHTIS